MMIRFLGCLFISCALTACAGTKSSAPPSTYVVFFAPNSAELPAEAKPALDRAAAAVKQTRPAHVAIAAGVARAGALPLAEPRYLAVRKALTDRGVAEAIIARASLPDTAVPVEAAGAQRVEIILDGR
jgi:outer membrane protein OmpA-like peptidoglycan-associated protein